MLAPQLVKIPDGPPWEDTHEGGVNFYFCVGPGRDAVDLVSVGNSQSAIRWTEQECAQSRSWDGPRDVDAAMLIGTVRKTLRNTKDANEPLFQPAYSDLTPQGQTLHDLLASIYGEVEIVTLLDT